MEPEDHIRLVGTLLDLVQQMEQTLKDYCRMLMVHQDGHWLEQKENSEEPF